MDGSNRLDTDGWYHHPPGAPTRKAVLDVGLKCTHSCKTCFYSYMDGSEDQFQGMRHAKFHSTEWLKRLVHVFKANGFYMMDYTGGEPLIHPGIVEITQEATNIGLATRMITLGQFFARKEFDLLRKLLDAGLTDINFSTHAATEDLFKDITGESLAKQTLARDFLDDMGFRYSSNCTVSNRNYKTLPDIARYFAAHPGTYVVNFIQFMPRYKWQQHAPEVEAPFGEVMPYLREAVDILTARDIAVNIRYSPLCTVYGIERHMVGFVGVRYDPSEWGSSQTHYEDDSRPVEEVGARMVIRPGEVPGMELWPTNGKLGDLEIIAARGAPGAATTVFPKKCAGCAKMAACDGLDANYLLRHGDGELQPYEGPPSSRFLLKERLEYLPAFRIKVKQDAK